MVAEQRQFITQEAYMAMEREAFEKSEYFEGELAKETNQVDSEIQIGTISLTLPLRTIYNRVPGLAAQ